MLAYAASASSCFDVPGYVFLQNCALGRFAKVGVFRDEATLNTVAIKTYQIDETDASEVARVAREIAMLHKVKGGPNIVQIKTSIEVSLSQRAIVLEFIGGGDMDRDNLFANRQETRQFVRGVLEALQFLREQGIVHRDIKSTNIMRRVSGEPVLIDVGDAYSIDEDLSNARIVQPGFFRSPEVILQGKYTFDSDMWSFGITICEMVSNGNTPFQMAEVTPAGKTKTTNERQVQDARYLRIFHYILGKPPLEFMRAQNQAQVSTFYTVVAPSSTDPQGAFILHPQLTMTLPTKQSIVEWFNLFTQIDDPDLGKLVAKMICWTGRITADQAIEELDLLPDSP